jgi:hypothetical protein
MPALRVYGVMVSTCFVSLDLFMQNHFPIEVEGLRLIKAFLAIASSQKRADLMELAERMAKEPLQSESRSAPMSL